MRSGIVGTGLWLMLTTDPDRNLRHCGLAYLALVVWCYYDPFTYGRRWSTAAVLGFTVYLVSVQFARLLAAAFGAPVLAATSRLIFGG